MINSAIRKVALALSVAVLLIPVFTATANASASAIYQACSTGGDLSSFSESDLKGARGGVPADLDEYYSCTAQIDAALLDKATGGPTGKGGSGKGVKGRREQLKNASVDDLTSDADRKKAAAQVANETKLDPKHPLGDADPVISAAAGKTLASSTAPGTSIALVIGILGLLLLLGADLAGRLGKMPSVKKYLPGSDPRDGD